MAFCVLFQGYYKDTVEFYFDDRNQCKNFWKKCVEHHAFFRCQAANSCRPGVLTNSIFGSRQTMTFVLDGMAKLICDV